MIREPRDQLLFKLLPLEKEKIGISRFNIPLHRYLDREETSNYVIYPSPPDTYWVSLSNKFPKGRAALALMSVTK